MRPPRLRPSCRISEKVKCIFEKMKIVEDQDIEHEILTDPNVHSPHTCQNTYYQHKQNISQSQRRRPIQTSLYDFLPQAFQDRYGHDEAQNEEW